MFRFLFLVFFFFFCTVHLKPGSYVSFMAFGGAGIDQAQDVQETIDGGYVVAGQTTSFGSGSYDILLSKFGSDGSHITHTWTKTYGGLDMEYGSSVQQTSDEGYIVVGHSLNYGDGNYDVLLSKFGSDGSHSWSKALGGPEHDVPHSVQLTSDGGYIITGTTSSFSTNVAVLLSKFATNGSHEFSKILSSPFNDNSAYSIQQTFEGGYIIAGHTRAIGSGRYSVILSKFASDGSNEWTRTLHALGSSDGYAYSVQQTSDGGYILAGKLFGAGNFDMLLSKFFSNGSLAWAKTLGGSSDDGARSVQQTNDGGYVVAGGTRSIGSGNSDMLLSKFDSYGNHEWTRIFGGSQYDEAFSIQQTSSGGYVLAGQTASFGPGSYDIFLSLIDSTGVGCSMWQGISPTVGDASGFVLATPVFTLGDITDSISHDTVFPTVISQNPTIVKVCEMCSTNYYGDFCNITTCYDVLSNETNVCLNRGKCSEYNKCVCNAGYFGNNCEDSDLCSETCTSNGECVTTDYCSCKSGYYSSDCENITSCSDWKTADPLKTDYVPSLLKTSRIQSNNIILNFISPVVTERYNYEIKIGGVGSNVCDSWYGPGWTQGAVDCNVTNYGVLSWDDVENLCGWDTSSSTTDLSIYKNTIHFTVKEELNPVHRTIEYKYDIIIQIPTSTIVDVISIDILAPVSLEAVLFEQNVNPLSNTGFFKLFTRVDYPYQLTFGSILSDPTLVTSSMTVLGSNCLVGSGDCDQEWFNNIAFHASKCDISGVYSYRFLLNCRPGYASCPYEDEIVDITTTIVSEEFCDPIQIETDISAILQSCEDIDCVTPENGFLTTETSYYQVDVTSLELELHESEVLSVWLTGASSVNFYVERNITSAGIIANFAETKGISPRFQFDHSSLSIGVYTVHAKVAVTYLFETTRRTVINEEVYLLNVDKEVEVLEEISDPSSSTFDKKIMWCVVISVLIFFV